MTDWGIAIAGRRGQSILISRETAKASSCGPGGEAADVKQPQIQVATIVAVATERLLVSGLASHPVSRLCRRYRSSAPRESSDGVHP